MALTRPGVDDATGESQPGAQPLLLRRLDWFYWSRATVPNDEKLVLESAGPAAVKFPP
jgi:hypothetical protein